MAILITDKFQLRQRNFLDDRQGMASSIADLKFWDFLTVPIPEGFEVYVNGVWYIYKSTNEDDPATGKFRTRESGGLDIEAMWRELEADDETKQINSTHLSNALKKYLPLSGNSADDPMTGPIYLKFGNEDKSANIDDEYLSYRLKNGSATRDAQVSASYGFYYNYALGGSSSTRKYSQIIDDHITLYSLLDGTSSHTVHIFSDRISIDGNYVRHAGDTYYSNGSLVIGGVTVPISGEGIYLPLTAGRRYPLTGPLYITNDTGQYGSAKIYIDDENSGDFIIDVSDTFNDRLVVEGDDGILASKFIVPGGSTGFLKADGSIDNNSYFLKSGGTVGYQANKTTPLTVYGYMGSSYIQFESGSVILGKLGFETNTSTGTISPICVVGNTINTIRHSGDTYYESDNDRLVVGGVTVPLDSGPSTLSGLSDVLISNPLENNLLRYEIVNNVGVWRNFAPNYLTVYDIKHIQISHEVSDYKSVGQAKEEIIGYLNSQDYGIGDTLYVPASYINQWDDDSASYYASYAFSMIKIGGTSSGSSIGQWLLTSFGGNRIGYVGRSSNTWTPIRWLSTTEDLDNYLPLIGNSSSNPMIGNINFYDDCGISWENHKSYISADTDNDLWVNGHNNVLLSVGDGSSLGENIKVTVGSESVLVNNRLIIEDEFGRSTDINGGSIDAEVGISVDGNAVRHAGDTYYSNGILVVGGETVPTSEEPEQLSDLSDVSLVEPLNSNQLLRYEIVGNVGVWRNFTPNYITAFDVKHIQVSDSIPDNLTVGQAKTSIYNYTYNQNFGVGDTLVTPASYIYQWDDNSASYYSSDYFSMTKIGGAYWGSSGQWLLSSRGDTRIGYVGRYQGGSWTSIKWLSTTDDLNNYLPLTGNSRNNPITGDLYIAGDTNRFGPVKIWTDEDENGEFIIDLSETNDNRLIVKGTSEINGGLKVRGRYQNNGDAEGIVIGTADNGHAVLCLGNPKSERSVFYFSGDDVFWRYNNGTTSYDIEHPKQNGTIALRSDLLEYLPLTGGQMISDGTYNGQIYFPVDSGIVLDTDSYIKVLEDDSYLHINGYQAIILEIREDESSNPIEKVKISDEGLEMIMTEYLGTKLGTLLTDTTLKISGSPIFVPGSSGITPTTEVTAGRITINGYDVIHIGNWRNYIGNTRENQVTYASSASTAGSASYADESNTATLAIKLADNINSPATDGLTASDIVNETLNRTSLSRLIDTLISEPSNLNVLMWLTTANSWTNVSKDNFISLYGLAKTNDLNKYLPKTAGWSEKVGGVLVLDNILALKDQYEDSNYVGLYNYGNELNFIKNYSKSSSEYIRATVIDSTNWRNYIGNTRENQVTYASSASTAGSASYADESNTATLAIKLADNINSPATDGLTASDIVNEVLNRTSLSRLIDTLISEPSNLNVLMWLTTANSWTNVSKDNFISLYGLAKTNDLNGYLPLTAGPNNSLTGDLYMGTHKLNMMSVGNVGTTLNHEKLEIKAFGAYGEQQPNTTITAGSISINGVHIPYVIKIPTNTTYYDANNYTQNNTLYVTEGDIVPRTITGWNNFPVTAFSGGFSLVCITEGNYKRQLFSKYDSPFIWVRYQNYSNVSGGAAWTGWQRMATLSDIDIGDYLPLSGNSAANPMTGNINWGNVLNNGLYWDDNDISVVADADHCLVLTGLNGINLNSSYSNNTLMSVSDDYGTSIYGALGNGRTQIIKPVAEFVSSELYGYGYIVIELPQIEITGYYMVSLAMTIDIVNDSDNLISYDISGSLYYFNNNGDWSYPIVNCFIDAPLIRFGFNGTNFVIVIGKIGPTGTFWNSPTVVVRNVLITGGISESTEGSDFAYNALCKNWTISFSKNVDNISFLSSGINVKNILVTNSDGDLDIGQHFIKFGNNRTWKVGYDSGITVLNSLSGDSSSTDGSPLKSYSSALHSAGLSVVGAAIGFQLAVTDDDYKLCYRAKKSSSDTYSDWKKLLDIDGLASYLPLSGNSAANPMTGNINWGNVLNNGLYWDDNDISIVADVDHYLVLTGFSGIDFRSSYSNSTLMSVSDDYGLKMGKNQISRIILDDEYDDFDGLEIKLAARNLRITTGDSSKTLYINYDSTSITNGTVPNLYRWHDGTSTGYASHYMGLVQATKFKLTNGTSSQFLKADGSVDSNSYITASALSSYLPLNGNSTANPMTGNISWGNGLGSGLYWDDNDISVVADADHHLVLTAYDAIDFNVAVTGSSSKKTVAYIDEDGVNVSENLIICGPSGNEKSLIVKNPRKKSDGGEWSVSSLVMTGYNNASYFSIGAYGSNNNLLYAYLGANSFDSVNNLRIYSDTLKWGDSEILTVDNVKHLQVSNIIEAGSGKTIGQAKSELVSLIGNQSERGIGDTYNVSASLINNWDNDSASYTESSIYSLIKIGGGYIGSTYGRWLLASYGDTGVGVVGRSQDGWTPIRWFATTDDLKGRYGNFYNFVAQTRVSSTGWCKFTFPHVHTTSTSNRWFMLSFDLVLGSSYMGGPNGTIHVRYYFQSTAGSYATYADEVRAAGIGCNLDGLRICYDVTDSANMYVYIGRDHPYADIAIKNLTAEDSARYDYGFDYRNTKASEYNAIPYNITDIQIYKLSGNEDSFSCNNNLTMGTNSIVFSKLTSSTWDIAQNSGLMILNTVGASSTGAPGEYHVGLSVSGYYGFQLAVYGGSDGGLLYRKIGDSKYTETNYDFSWKELIDRSNISSYLSEYLPKSAGSGNPLTGDLYIQGGVVMKSKTDNSNIALYNQSNVLKFGKNIGTSSSSVVTVIDSSNISDYLPSLNYIPKENNYLSFTTFAGKSYIGWRRLIVWDIGSSNQWDCVSFSLYLTRIYNSPKPESYHISVVWSWNDLCSIKVLNGDTGGNEQLISKMRMYEDSTNHKLYLEMYVDTKYSTYDNEVYIRAFGNLRDAASANSAAGDNSAINSTETNLISDLHLNNTSEVASTGKTVGQVKTAIVSELGKQKYGVGDTIVVSDSCIYQWNDDSKSCYASGVFSMTKIAGGYNGSVYGQWLLSSLGDRQIGYVGRSNNSWTPLRWFATTDDLSGYLPLTGGTLSGTLRISGSNSITGSASFNSALLVDNNVEIDGYLYVDNPTTINSTLSIDDNTSIYGSVGIGTSASSSYKLVVQGGMSFFYGNIGVGTSPVSSYAIDVDGSVRASSWVTNSDSRLKDIVDYDVCISSESVAVAPIVSFLWKNHHDRGIQVGSIAQYWQDLVPEAVHSDDNGYLSMQYDVIALLSAIAVARKVQNHEERILELEQENKILREKISNLEKAS